MMPGKPIIVIILLSCLGLTRGQRIGQACNYNPDGRKGVCRELKECLDQQGTSASAKRTKLCSNPDLGTVVVCCRSSVRNIALKKCQLWQEERRALSSRRECVATIPLVHGGTRAYAGEFPHIVSVMENNNGKLSHVCGGTLIARNWVLTAAHCVVPRNLMIRVGAHDLREAEEDITLAVQVLERFRHSEYKPPEVYNDIALLQLAYSAPITERIQPACLPYSGSRVKEGERLNVAGWGQTPEGVRFSDLLLKAEVRSLSRATCRANPHYSTNPLALVNYPAGITDSILCMDESEQGSCQGDSGGPLMRDSGDSCTQTVLGVVSRGVQGCQSSTIPSTYTNVEYYLEWIVNKIWKEEEGIS